MTSHAQVNVLMSWGRTRRRPWRREALRTLSTLEDAGLVKRLRGGDWKLTDAGVLTRDALSIVYDHGRLRGRIDSQDGGPELLNVTAEVRHRHPILCGAWPPPESEERKAS